MSLPNEIFRDIPVEYKKINIDDFDRGIYNVEDKINLDVSEEGYISSSLSYHLERDINNVNTTVINAGVGQGKSRTIISMVNKFVNNGYKVVIAVPFNNLIKQYKKDCEQFISGDRIFNIHSLQEEPTSIFGYINLEHVMYGFDCYDIHLLTVNSLLGNPGENSPFQSKKRIDYFNELRENCESKNQKMVIIFDEIHDAIENFKEEFIYRLWNFQGLIHKIYTISATYNEASKEVIKYLSELTEKNILILESERKRILSKQSNLHLNTYSSSKIENDVNLKKVLFDLVKHNKPFDIMVYSKSLIKKMLEEPFLKHSMENIESNIEDENISVSHILHYCHSNINRCYSDIFDSINANNRYNKDKINIGTNFTTGVNIEKENHTYIVLFPKDVNIDFFNNKGVFNNGATSVTQVLARQRKKGDIHIFVPMPAMIEKNSLPYDGFYNKKILDTFEKMYNPLKKTIKYTDINREREKLDFIYNQLKEQVSRATEKIESTDRRGTNRLLYPTKEIFILDKSEKILNNTFFGGDLSSYILWAAITNQFVNCNLTILNYLKKLHFSDDKDEMFNKVNELFQENKNLLLEANQSYEDYELHPMKLVEEIDKFYMGYEEVYVGERKATKSIKKEIKLYNLSLVMNLNVIPKTTVDIQQIYYHYLKSSIYYSEIYNSNPSISNYLVVHRNDNFSEKIDLYKKLHQLVECIDNSKQLNRKGEYIVAINPNSLFVNTFSNEGLANVLNSLSTKDFFLGNVFNFKSSLSKANTISQKNKFIYKLLISAVFDGKRGNTTKDNRKISIYKIKELKWDNLTNLIYEPFYLE